MTDLWQSALKKTARHVFGPHCMTNSRRKILYISTRPVRASVRREIALYTLETIVVLFLCAPAKTFCHFARTSNSPDECDVSINAALFLYVSLSLSLCLSLLDSVSKNKSWNSERVKANTKSLRKQRSVEREIKKIKAKQLERNRENIDEEKRGERKEEKQIFFCTLWNLYLNFDPSVAS